MYTTAALRQVSFRSIGWLAVVAMLAAAVFGPAAPRALATHVEPIAVSDGNPTCASFAQSHGGNQDWEEFKLEADGLADGSHTVGDGMTITISNFDHVVEHDETPQLPLI